MKKFFDPFARRNVSHEEVLLQKVLTRLDRIEQRVTAIIEADIARNERPVSPAKAPKKCKYVKSGKYAKRVTTKKK